MIDKNGNRALLGICSMNIVLYIGTYFFYKSMNKRRDRIWSAWSKEVSILQVQSSWMFKIVTRTTATTGISGNNPGRRKSATRFQICVLESFRTATGRKEEVLASSYYEWIWYSIIMYLVQIHTDLWELETYTYTVNLCF